MAKVTCTELLPIFLFRWKKWRISDPVRKGQVFLYESNSLFVNCSYETILYPALFWYVQYPGEGPQLLFTVTRAQQK
jgi:T cell receptor alpha chain V region